MVWRSSLVGERNLRQDGLRRTKHAQPPSATAAAAGTPTRTCRRQQAAPIAANDVDQGWQHGEGRGGTMRPSAVREGVEQGWLQAAELRLAVMPIQQTADDRAAKGHRLACLCRRPLAAHCRGGSSMDGCPPACQIQSDATLVLCIEDSKMQCSGSEPVFFRGRLERPMRPAAVRRRQRGKQAAARKWRASGNRGSSATLVINTHSLRCYPGASSARLSSFALTKHASGHAAA